MGLIRKIKSFLRCCYTQRKHLASAGANASIQKPCYITAAERLHMEENTVIRRGATILNNHHENLYIKKYTVISTNCTIVTNNHKSTVGIPQCLLGASHVNDVSKDLVIAEDIFVGANVTIMSGGDLGRGCIIGACSLVTKPIPPYAIAVGSPARVVGVKFTIEQILKHESILYPPEERMSREELEALFDKYYQSMKPYGVETPLTDDDLAGLDWAINKRHFIQPKHAPIVFKKGE